MSKNQTEILNDLFNKYNLFYDEKDPKNSDVFITSRYKIITRSGIDKIQASIKANASFDVIYVDPYEIILKGTFSVGENIIETFGEASIDRNQISTITESFNEDKVGGKDDNVVISTSRSRQKIDETLLKKGNVGQNPPYLAAMAEKRARSRGVLRLAGLYDLGFYGEDESEDFSSAVRSQKSKVSVG